MSDIVVALGVMVALSAGAFGLGLIARRRSSPHGATVIGLLLAASLLAFAMLVHGRLWLANLVPFSSAIVLANWLPLGFSFLAGMIAGQPALPWWRKGMLSALVLGVALFALGYDVARPRAGVPDRELPQDWTPGGLRLQSIAATSGPCCAITLLKSCDIAATEREMVDLCLTNERGTPELGLFRALVRLTRDTPWRAEVFRTNEEGLRGMPPARAMLLLDVDEASDDPAGAGWNSPSGRAVVFYRFTDDGQVEVGDPAAGQRQWTLDDLRSQWNGQGLRLVKRE